MICLEEGLTLEKSAFQNLYGGQITLLTHLINEIRNENEIRGDSSLAPQRAVPVFQFIQLGNYA